MDPDLNLTVPAEHLDNDRCCALLSELKPTPFNITMYGAGHKEIGRLEEDGEQLVFSGKADEAARVFFEYVIGLYSKQAQELKDAKARIFEAEGEVKQMRLQISLANDAGDRDFVTIQHLKRDNERLIEAYGFLRKLADAAYPKGYDVKIAVAAYGTSLEAVAYSNGPGLGGTSEKSEVSNRLVQLIDELKKFRTAEVSRPTLTAG